MQESLSGCTMHQTLKQMNCKCHSCQQRTRKLIVLIVSGSPKSDNRRLGKHSSDDSAATFRLSEQKCMCPSSQMVDGLIGVIFLHALVPTEHHLNSIIFANHTLITTVYPSTDSCFQQDNPSCTADKFAPNL